MKATRSYRSLHALQATEHRLSAVIEGVEYVASYALPHATYEHLDPAFSTKMIEYHLWTNLMRTIEHNLRKNLTHA